MASGRFPFIYLRPIRGLLGCGGLCFVSLVFPCGLVCLFCFPCLCRPGIDGLSDPSQGVLLGQHEQLTSGELDKYPGFLLQCRMIFHQWSLCLFSDTAKIDYILGLLGGRVLAWVIVNVSKLLFSDFKAKLKAVLTIQ